MNADDLKKLTTDSIDRLATLLHAGQSDQLAAFLKAMARFHRYSFHNVCLIASQRPTATRVAGFHAWHSLNRFVRRGEKGIVILAPIVVRRRADDDAKHIAGFRAAYVFDVAQTEGEPLPNAATASGDPGYRIVQLREAIAARGITLDDVDDLGGALGTSAGGRIQIVKGLSPAEEFVVLVHELAHELLHRAVDRPASRDVRELERSPWPSWSAKQSVCASETPRATTSTSIGATAKDCWRPSTGSVEPRPRSSRRSTPLPEQGRRQSLHDTRGRVLTEPLTFTTISLSRMGSS